MCNSETPNKFGLLENSAINMNGYWEYIGDYNENEKQIISAIKDSSGVVYRAIKTTGVFDGKSERKSP
jgi:hypothetical protein